jgi:hypothetical protein
VLITAVDRSPTDDTPPQVTEFVAQRACARKFARWRGTKIEDRATEEVVFIRRLFETVK